MTVDLERDALDHLWLHFTAMGEYRDGPERQDAYAVTERVEVTSD